MPDTQSSNGTLSPDQFMAQQSAQNQKKIKPIRPNQPKSASPKLTPDEFMKGATSAAPAVPSTVVSKKDRTPTVEQRAQKYFESHPIVREGLLGAAAGTGIPESKHPVSDTVKGLWQTVTKPPETKDEKAVQGIGLPVPVYRLAKGFIQQEYGFGQEVFDSLDWSKFNLKTGNVPFKEGSGGAPQFAHGIAGMVTSILTLVKGGEKVPEAATRVGEAAEALKTGIKEHSTNASVDAATKNIRQITTGVGPDFAERLDRAITRGYLPEIERLKKPRDVREAATAILDYADKIQKDIVKPAVERHAMDTISGDDVAKAVQDSLTPEIEKYFPESLGPITKEAGRYANTAIRLDEANLLVEKLNAINRVLEKASPEDASAAQKVNVAKGASKAAANKLRELLYTKLDTLGEKGIREYQKDYGALRTVGEALRDKAPRAERIGKGSTLAESAFRKHPWITLVSLVGGYGFHTPAMAAIPFMSWVMEKRGTPNALITRAMKRLGKTDFAPVKPPLEFSETVETPASAKASGSAPATERTPVATVPNADNDLAQSAARQFMAGKVSAAEYKELLRKSMPDATEETLNRVVKGLENLKRSREQSKGPASSAPQ